MGRHSGVHVPEYEWLAYDENKEPMETHRTLSVVVVRYCSPMSEGKDGGCANPCLERLEELSGSESDSSMQELE